MPNASRPKQSNPTYVNSGFALVGLGAILVGIAGKPLPVAKFWSVILFYTVLIWIVYLNREKLDWQGRFIAKYNTKIGLKLMERWGKHRRFWKAFGWCAIVVGFAGMAYITYIILKAVVDFIYTPEVPPAIAPVLPGVPVPGWGFTLPLVLGWLVLFVCILIHEFSHGVVARAHNVPVHSSGLLFAGPILGAFVEPDEKKLPKERKSVQLAIFAAGPFSNIITGIAGLLIASLLLLPLILGMFADQGIMFSSVSPGYPASKAGLQPGVVYTKLNGQPIGTNYTCATLLEQCYPEDFFNIMNDVKPGDTLVFTDANAQEYVLTATARPDNESLGYIGVETTEVLRDPSKKIPYLILWKVFSFFFWFFFISLGLGLANLLPMGPVDGGRMFQLVTRKLFGEVKGDIVWTKTAVLFFYILIGLVLASIVKFWILPYI